MPIADCAMNNSQPRILRLCLSRNAYRNRSHDLTISRLSWPEQLIKNSERNQTQNVWRNRKASARAPKLKLFNPCAPSSRNLLRSRSDPGLRFFLTLNQICRRYDRVMRMQDTPTERAAVLYVRECSSSNF